VGDTLITFDYGPETEPSRMNRNDSGALSMLGRIAQLLAVVGLAVFNVWWYVRDTRPLPPLHTVAARINEQRYAEAETALREHLRRFPHDSEGRMLLARSLGARNQLLACAAQLHRVPEWSPNKRHSLYLEGICYKQLDRARDAETAWRACIAPDVLRPRFDPYLKMAVEQIVDLAVLEERRDDARNAIWLMYDVASPADRPDILILMLRTWIDRIDPSIAVGQLRKIVAADPADLPARRALAHAYELLGDSNEATELVQSNLKTWPDDPGVWSDRLGLLKLRDDLQGLTAALAELPPSIDHTSSIHTSRGLVCERKRDWPCAVDAYRRACESMPYNSEFLFRMGMCEMRDGRGEIALLHLKQSRDLQKAQESLPDAILDYRDAIVSSADPGHPTRVKASRKLAAICRTLGMDRLSVALYGESPSP
jgi:Flp pilus assembly protein TadD